MNSQAQLSAAQQLASGAGAGVPNLQNSGVGGGDDDDDDIPELEAVEEDGNVDETGVDPKDIELVIQQVGCSRAKAVRVLKESGGDLINASTYMSYAHLKAKPNVLTMSYSYGRERVIVPCFIVSLPHCFALSCLVAPKIYPLGSFMTCTCSRAVLHIPSNRVISLLPTSQFYIVVRPLPAVLSNVHTPESPTWDNSFRGLSYH